MNKILIAMAAAACFMTIAAAQDDVQKATAEAAAAILEAPEAVQAAEEPNWWTNSFQVDLGFNQTNLWSWAAGGYNTLSLNSGIDAKANYAKEMSSWNNRLQLQYGFLWSADKANLLQKSNDLMYLESRFAYKTSEESKWNYTVSFDFRSQFSNSYDSYTQDANTGLWSGTLKSGFLAPAYTNLAIGMEWAPADWFNVNIAPLTAGYTICNIEELRKSYGMKLKEDGLDPNVGANYKSALFQSGAQVKINLKASVNDNLSYETQLVLFTDYLNHPFRYNRVNWDNKISWQFAKLFKVALNTWLIYDPIVLIDGQQKVQFKESFSISFTYLIANK